MTDPTPTPIPAPTLPPNDSRWYGYLTPDATVCPEPNTDLDLFEIFQTLIAGVTGLPSSLVRPRWQPYPPLQPDITTNWIAVGVHTTHSDGFSWDLHNPALAGGIGEDLVITNTVLEVLCSCYGPKANFYASRIRAGLALGQNQAALLAHKIRVIHVEDAKIVPRQINTQWYNIVDLMVHMNREDVQVYPIRTIVQAKGTIVSEDEDLPFETETLIGF